MPIAPPRPSCEPVVEDSDVVLGACSAWTDADQAVRDAVIAATSQLIWSMSGRQIGVCSSTVWPCIAAVCGCGSCGRQRLESGDYLPPLSDCTSCGNACECAKPCGCVALRSLVLDGPYPVLDIGAVRVGGVVVDPSHYRVDDWRNLILLDSFAWPRCNDLSTPDAGMSVEYRWGNPPDELDRIAARTIALELVKSFTCPSECRMDPRVTSITGYGNTIQLDADALEWSVAQLPEIKAWLSARNPGEVAGTAFVFDRSRRSSFVGTA